MPIERLTDTKIRNAKVMLCPAKGRDGEPLKHAGKPIPYFLNDGKGLLLRVTAGGSKSWIYRYKNGRKAHDIGLGPYPERGLAWARERATELRTARLDGDDPLKVWRAARKPTPSQLDEKLTFRQVAEKWVERFEKGWSAQHRKDLLSKFAVHVYPVIGEMPIGEVDDQAVLRVIDPAGKWMTKTETMARVRSQLESVLAFAMSPQPGRPQGYRPKGDNPARMDGHLEFQLVQKSKIAKPEKQPAMRWQDIPAYVGELRSNTSIVARALEFVILTAARTDEVLGATWAEIDLEGRTWTISGKRMKAGRNHRVALSEAAVRLLTTLPKGDPSALIFPGKYGQLANNSMTRIVEKCTLESEDGRRPTVHGFRGTFRTWALEHDHRHDVIEMALAHKSGDDVADRYTHTDLLKHRQRLADDWGRYCRGEPERQVVSLHRA